MFDEDAPDMMKVDIKGLDDIENGNRAMAKDIDDPNSDIYGSNDIENDPNQKEVKSYDGIIKSLEIDDEEIDDEAEEDEEKK